MTPDTLFLIVIALTLVSIDQQLRKLRNPK